MRTRWIVLGLVLVVVAMTLGGRSKVYQPVAPKRVYVKATPPPRENCETFPIEGRFTNAGGDLSWLVYDDGGYFDVVNGELSWYNDLSASNFFGTMMRPVPTLDTQDQYVEFDFAESTSPHRWFDYHSWFLQNEGPDDPYNYNGFNDPSYLEVGLLTWVYTGVGAAIDPPGFELYAAVWHANSYGAPLSGHRYLFDMFANGDDPPGPTDPVWQNGTTGTSDFSYLDALDQFGHWRTEVQGDTLTIVHTRTDGTEASIVATNPTYVGQQMPGREVWFWAENTYSGSPTAFHGARIDNFCFGDL